ncbi:MAG: hydroxyacylglutathione hydrolase [Gammaproteobacteria bacterium]|nr:hydroxyacylglutathione hydrolase [Gammaproteobacteria bacterium]
MSIFALKAFQDNYIWIIPQTTSFICVDPGDATPVLDFAKQEKLELTAILITHNHTDHIGGVKQLIQHFPNAVIYNPERTVRCFTLGPYTFDVLNTPGHTKNHICYFEPNQHWLFCGDTLFSAGCGRVFDGTIEALFDSLNTLKQLPEDTKVFCAHEYTRQNLKFALTVEPENKIAQQHLSLLESNPEQISLPSTISLEKAINPFFRLDARGIQAFVADHNQSAETKLDYFKCLRDAKDHF